MCKRESRQTRERTKRFLLVNPIFSDSLGQTFGSLASGLLFATRGQLGPSLSGGWGKFSASS